MGQQPVNDDDILVFGEVLNGIRSSHTSETGSLRNGGNIITIIYRISRRKATMGKDQSTIVSLELLLTYPEDFSYS